MVSNLPDPIHEYKEKWWFWDETWSERIGPYDTEAEANLALSSYISQLSEQHDGLIYYKKQLCLLCIGIGCVLAGCVAFYIYTYIYCIIM